jgi:hypothetical protein
MRTQITLRVKRALLLLGVLTVTSLPLLGQHSTERTGKVRAGRSSNTGDKTAGENDCIVEKITDSLQQVRLQDWDYGHFRCSHW